MPVRDIDKITEAIALKSIAGFLVDTCVYEGKNFSFGNGILQQLVTLKDHDLKLFYTDVIYHEILNHLESTLAEQRRAFEKAIGALGGGWAVSKDTRLEITGRIFGPGSVQEYCKQVLDDFFAAADAEEIQCHGMVEVQDILDLYHEKKPPFSERKKHEFPDALTLLAMDRWAFYNDKQVVVVSSDGDVENFCNESDGLVCVKDLSAAISTLHSDKSVIDIILRKFRSGDFRMQEYFNDQLYLVTDKIAIKESAHSWLDFEVEVIDLSVLESNIPLETALEGASLIEQTAHAIKLELRVPCRLGAVFDVSFSKWDGEDGVPYWVGSSQYARQVDVDLSFIADFEISMGDIAFIDIELQRSAVRFYLGEVSPWDDERQSEADDQEA